jgi:hypothetical protein
MVDKGITIELSRDEWIALIAAAFYGSDAIENGIGGHTAGIVDRLVDQLKVKLRVASITDEAIRLEASSPPSDDGMLLELGKPSPTPSA